MRIQLNSALIVVVLPALAALVPFQSAFAASPTPTPSSTASSDSTTNAERVDTEAIKEKYWARGDETEIGVVQNRLYSKAHKVEFQIIGGIISSDPFVSTYSLGGRLGYHFSEYFSAHLLAWKSWASPSNAQTVAGSSAVEIGTAFNTDYARSYYGGEFQASLLYGKLSLVGKAIIYYDLHFLAGLGDTDTESGNNFTQSVGIGQQFYVSKRVSVIFDYRLMHYKDTLLNKTVPSELDQPAGVRTNWTNSISLGFGFLFGSGK
jgi:outer membrane beta-barrel protein